MDKTPSQQDANVHPIFAGVCRVMSGDALRDARREPIAEDVKLGGTNLESANEGALTAEDLAAIDAQFGK